MKYYRLECSAYELQDIPEVGHGVWTFCAEKHRVTALAIGEIAYRVKFHSLAGASYINVVRLEDKEN